jgi:hypothetical protein
VLIDLQARKDAMIDDVTQEGKYPEGAGGSGSMNFIEANEKSSSIPTQSATERNETLRTEIE